jgi:N utilization substance protein B
MDGVSTRRNAREWVLQLLFELDMNPCELDALLARFWEGRPCDAKVRRFTERLVRGVREHAEAIDRTIAGYLEHWDLHRMGGVDRNVLRMAFFELLFCDDIPPVVSINEAVDVAKYFSTGESGRFVNGILDRARKDLARPARSAKA